MPSQPTELFVLLETAAGFVLTHVNEWEGIAKDIESVQESLLDPQKFSQVVSVKAVHPFRNAEEALASCTSIAMGESTEALRTFLDQNLSKKRKRCKLGVVDPLLGKHLAEYDFPVLYDKSILELTRLARFHMKKLIKEFGDTDIMKFQIGLGHAFSRSKIRTDPNRQDKPVQNAVALLENIDKMINTFAMRVKEWYSWHFPELGVLVTDNIKFAQAAKLIGVKESFEEKQFNDLVTVLDGDEDLARQVMTARVTSMGQEIVQADMLNIAKFADHVVSLARQRQNLAAYLGNRLEQVAPNLQTLVGDVLAAKLIAHAGSLTSLAKCPASTIQILGAEKALFRALKTKGNTPKYGLLFQSSFIGRAAPKNKGRISRYVANKCSLAARIDNFATVPSNIFGEKMRDQVEARMSHLTDGVTTRRNLDVMKEASQEYEDKVADIVKKQKKEVKKKAKADASTPDSASQLNHQEIEPEALNGVGDTKRKREKKRSRAEADVPADEAVKKSSKKKEKLVSGGSKDLKVKKKSK